MNMNMMFDGKKIRNEILAELANKVVMMNRKPTLAVFLIGEDPVCEKYVILKQKLAEKTGIQFCLYKFDEKDSEKDIIDCIEFLNTDPETDGIMIQIPVSDKFDRDKLIKTISPKKDIDGLRYCLGLDSDFRPPVVEAILEAIKKSLGISELGSGILGKMKITLIGHGFLVGRPLERTLKELGAINLSVVTSDNIQDSKFKIQDSNIIISATGRAGIIKPEMVKEGAVLIDAGTAEENGELVGDIDPECYKKASFYTPVPGGIGPVTVAMLFRNLISEMDNKF